MIVVKIELWPCGDREKARLLGTCKIANIGGDLEYGDYGAALDYVTITGEDEEQEHVAATARVDSFPRLRHSPWHLLRRVLNACLKPDGGFTHITDETRMLLRVEDQNRPRPQA